MADAVEEEMRLRTVLAIHVAVRPRQVASQTLILHILIAGVGHEGQFPGLGVEDELVEAGTVVEGGVDRDDDAGSPRAVQSRNTVENGPLLKTGIGRQRGQGL